MNILIVSGFLGAGKTTFIKELIRRTGTNPVILENEYGDNTIDAVELRSVKPGEKKLEILEFMEGCVCCTMKDSFVNSVLTVYSGLSPEYLIIEPTGVGKLSNIINNIRPLLHGDIRLLKPVVVITPRSFTQNMNEWGDLYKDQVANAEIVVFSKCENESPSVLDMTESAIRNINPNAEIVKNHYSHQSDEWWRSCMDIDAADTDAIGSGDGISDFTQITINDAHLSNPSELIILLEDCLKGELGHIARAKGTIPVGGETLRFDLADGLYSITGSPQPDNQCVFIGRSLDKAGILRRLNSAFLGKEVSIARAYVNRKNHSNWLA